MRIKLSLERSKHYGEPTFVVSEDDRQVEHEIPISALCHRPIDGEPTHGDVAKNALVGWLAQHLERTC